MSYWQSSWRHWLEGVVHPFVVWSNYLRSARGLNSRQALLLARFNFLLTYHTGSQNAKPDALSHQFSPASEETGQENILPPVCVVGAAQWRVEQQMLEASQEMLISADCPFNHLYVPPVLRSAVLELGHTSQVACHPGH